MARPIAVRITAGGDADATIELARVLAARGCDLVSLATGHDPMAGLGAISLSDRIRHEAGIPTLVGAEVDTRPDINSVLAAGRADLCVIRSEEHTSELQSRLHLVCRLLLEKKKKYSSDIFI